MDQVIFSPQRVLLRGVRDVRKAQVRRQLSSEVAFIALPQDAGWLGFRHVKSVNNKPVALTGESLAASLTTEKLDAARALLRASARHNLGLARTTNLPNLPLEFLHARNRIGSCHSPTAARRFAASRPAASSSRNTSRRP